MAKQFSRQHQTFRGWRGKTPPSQYRSRIEKAHAKYPQATLTQLRGHGIGKPLHKLRKAPLWKRPPMVMNPHQQERMATSLEVVKLVRSKGYSLSSACKELGISASTVRKYTNAFRKKDRRWSVKRFDTIPRMMNISTNGMSIYIVVVDSRHASTIGKYHNAVRNFLDTGDKSYLRPFRNKRVKDIEGNWYTLETDSDAIYDIHERRPNAEFYTIYRGW